MADIRLAFRAMRRSPGLVLVVVLCIGLSVGMGTTIFAWLQGLVVHPLPAVVDMPALTSLTTVGPAGDEESLSYPDFLDLQEQSRSFTGMAAFAPRQFGLERRAGGEGQPVDPVWGVMVSADYSRVLGVPALLGRWFRPEEVVASGSAPVAVISYGLWQRRFAGDPAIVGSRVRINGTGFDVIGVAPQAFVGTISGIAFDLWLPLTMAPTLLDNSRLLEQRDGRWLRVFGRLRPGTTLSEADFDTHRIGAGLAATYREDTGRSFGAGPFDIGIAHRLRPLFGVLLGLTLLLLIIVCSNVANLLLARGTARRHEVGVRLALGASRWRIARQLLTENLVMAAGGAGLALGLAAWGRGLFPALLPPGPLPLRVAVPLDVRAFAFGLGITLLATLGFGLLPALSASGTQVTAALRGGGRGGSLQRSSWQGALVVLQLTLSLAALSCTGLFYRQLGAMRRIDRGFDQPEHVLLVTTDFSLAARRDPAQRRDLAERLVDGVRTLPGVQAAAIATFVPLGFTGLTALETHVDGYPVQAGENMSTLINRVGPGYFTTMGVPILRGRPIDERDGAEAPPVAVVNESFVRRYWPDRDPIGQRFELAGRPFVVVGVARDGKYRFDQLDQPAPPFAYLSYAQWSTERVTLHVRAERDPRRLIPAVRSVAASIDPTLPLLTPVTLDDYASLPLFPVRLGTTVLGVLAAAALALASLGLYAVLAYGVVRRTREIGIRMALGATGSQVMRVVLRQAGRHLGLALLCGVPLSLGLARLLGAVIPRLTPPTPQLLGAASVVLLLVTTAATLLPARQATRVDPLEAVRSDR